jgi:hypothetical protein
VLERESEGSSPLIVEVKTAWNYTPTLSFVFKVLSLIRTGTNLLYYLIKYSNLCCVVYLYYTNLMVTLTFVYA